jgi:hypothetical protein
VVWRVPHLPHSDHSDHPHPLRRQILIAVAIAALLATIVLLLLPPRAHGNFVYWVSEGDTTIGRAKINGTGANNGFIAGLFQPHAVAVDSKFVYWAQGGGPDGSIGRANLDGSGANPNFIPSSAGVINPRGIAVTASGLYWANGGGTIGRANLDGSGPNPALINSGSQICGLAADQSFIYWLDASIGQRIGRAALDGSSPDPNFITGVNAGCGIAVDGTFLYWAATASNAIGRAPVGGGAADNGFIANAGASGTSGVAVNPQYIFWGNPGTTDFIGRANLNGSSPNPTLISGPTNPAQLAAAPSNKITINSVTRKKKKGTAIVDAKVPGPGQVGIANSGTQDVAATATVKQTALTLTGASSFKLPIKALGKTRKKLNKQVKKKGKGKVKVTAFVTFLPAGVAGTFNSEPVKVKLVQKRRKTK